MLQKAFLLVMLCVSGSIAEADSGYGAPSSSYGAPSYSAPSYKADHGVAHTHHHYYHGQDKAYAPPQAYGPPPSYHAPPAYHPPPQHHQPYHAPPQQHYDPYGYAPGYGGYGEDPYIHLNKRELTQGALLFGAGLLKGVLFTALINNSNNGITIGKKR